MALNDCMKENTFVHFIQKRKQIMINEMTQMHEQNTANNELLCNVTKLTEMRDEFTDALKLELSDIVTDLLNKKIVELDEQINKVDVDKTRELISENERKIVQLTMKIEALSLLC